MSSTSRVLKTGSNQITMTYEKHKSNHDVNPARAVGVDVVKQTASLDYIIAHSDGKVIFCVDYINGSEGDKQGNGYGNYIVILHNDNLATAYCHLQKSGIAVKAGDTVKKGQVIGYMGGTGSANGSCHLHLELRKYKNTTNPCDRNTFEWLDPTPYLNANLPSQSVNTNPVVGFLDSAGFTSGKIVASGWAWAGAGSQKVTIKVYSGTKVVLTSTVTANKSRPDVKTAMKYSTDKVGYSASIDASKLSSGTYTVKAFVGTTQLTNTKTITVTNSAIVAGKPVVLNNTPVYSGETGNTIGKRTGTYYIWSNQVTNNRVRMTNSVANVGKVGQVSFFISKTDIK